ncbi:hypothetical protein Lmede01_19050 [Leuconostoc mesenteroides subsp. dextranicum]|nr:hypothetical protein Lmede01_19050 [Leuconostoc mesenteroides subsp. dextranicum]
MSDQWSGLVLIGRGLNQSLTDRNIRISNYEWFRIEEEFVTI